jgi:CRISPR system Cascade subunit CasA
MSDVTFDLLNEPWIPCRGADGRQRTLGLVATLEQAHEFAEVFDESPIVTAALHRLLLALLHASLDGPTRQQWLDLWNQGRFDPDVLHRYLDQPVGEHRIRDRFDLFHPTHPFFQSTKIPAEIKPSTIDRLCPELRNGGNGSAHFNRQVLHLSSEGTAAFSVAAATAARWLVAYQASALGGTAGGGRGSHLDAPLARGVVLLLRGRTLLETLLLNLVEYTQEQPLPRRHDQPAWARDSEPCDHQRPYAGYLDYLTWQSRAIHLLPDREGSDLRVAGCSLFQGIRATTSAPVLDPMLAYLRDDENEVQPVRPLRLQPHRVLWRDAEALFAVDAKTTQRAWQRPLTFERLASRLQRGHVSETHPIGLLALGWVSDQAKVELWRRDLLPLPPGYLLHGDLAAVLKQALAMAEGAATAMNVASGQLAVRLLSPLDPKRADKKAVSRLRDSLAVTRAYWPRLDAPFRQLMALLPADPQQAPDHLADWYQRHVRLAALAAWDERVGPLDRTARSLAAAAVGRQSLERGLAVLARRHGVSTSPSTAPAAEMESSHA